MRKIVISAVLALGATITLTAYAAAKWTPYGVITSVESYGDDTHVYGLDFSASQCANKSYGKVDYTLSAAKKEGFSRILTAALLSGRQIRVKFDATAYCEGGYPAIYGLQMQ